MSVFQRRFSNAEIVAATGITNDQLQNWMKRGLIIGQKDIDGGGSPGRHRSFSFFNVMEVAIAKAIIDAGGMSDLKDVFRAAHHFAHFGEGELPGKPARRPSVPFNTPMSKTLLLAGRGWSDEILLTGSDSVMRLSASILRAGGCTVVDASAAFYNALNRLGIEPSAVMHEAYGD